MSDTITLSKADLSAMIADAVKEAQAALAPVVNAAPVVTFAAPVDLTGFDHKGKGNAALVKSLMRFVSEGDAGAPHTYSQRKRLLALTDRGGPDFQAILDSKMNRITAAVASYWLEKGRPVKYGELTFIPRMA